MNLRSGKIIYQYQPEEKRAPCVSNQETYSTPIIKMRDLLNIDQSIKAAAEENGGKKTKMIKNMIHIYHLLIEEYESFKNYTRLVKIIIEKSKFLKTDIDKYRLRDDLTKDEMLDLYECYYYIDKVYTKYSH